MEHRPTFRSTITSLAPRNAASEIGCGDLSARARPDERATVEKPIRPAVTASITNKCNSIERPKRNGEGTLMPRRWMSLTGSCLADRDFAKLQAACDLGGSAMSPRAAHGKRHCGARR
jgi:hypothetical protein